jgi:hypothetical protein
MALVAGEELFQFVAIFVLMNVLRACTLKCGCFACLREAATAKAGHAGVSDMRDRGQRFLTDTDHGHGHDKKRG